jgi:hypothetical protein
MNDVLEFFRLSEAVPLVLLICLLRFVGGQIAGEHAAPRWWARGFAAAGFLSYAIAGIALWEPKTPHDFLRVGAQAVLAMGTVHGLALVTLPVVRFLYLQLWAMPLERQRLLAEERARKAESEKRTREAAERQKAERDQKVEEERRKQEEIANRPPPPTREERIAAAQERFDKTLALLASAKLDDTELRAAKERAKQQYLRELDEAMNEAI